MDSNIIGSHQFTRGEKITRAYSTRGLEVRKENTRNFRETPPLTAEREAIRWRAPAMFTDVTKKDVSHLLTLGAIAPFTQMLGVHRCFDHFTLESNIEQ